ncbi:MAG: terminase [Gordonia sp. (in: high G+C Gram-positive bacteria)]|uniref:terminase n=1 Tax=Gordonia sp. (in: high G+C Gram-positive bacteria) TaxID=84139 RepID=UPI0039E688EA
MKWLANPPRGTQIVVGFDGSDSDDWTALRGQTRSGRQFTPRYGPDRRPTIWNPAEWGGQVPRREVHLAVLEVHDRWSVARGYYDPFGWWSEIGTWAEEIGADKVIEWPTNRDKAMFEAIKRFEVDLRTGAITHDGCPLTTQAVANSRRVPRPGQRYGLGKPHGEYHRKIDPAIASILADEAAGDATAADAWDETTREEISHVMYGFN